MLSYIILLKAICTAFADTCSQLIDTNLCKLIRNMPNLLLSKANWAKWINNSINRPCCNHFQCHLQHQQPRVVPLCAIGLTAGVTRFPHKHLVTPISYLTRHNMQVNKQTNSFTNYVCSFIPTTYINSFIYM